MKARSANWAAVSIRTLATANGFSPFAIVLSTGTGVKRLIVPHQSGVRVSRKLDKITWEHGADGKLVFAPRFVLRIETGVENIIGKAKEPLHRNGKRHVKLRNSSGRRPRRRSMRADESLIRIAKRVIGPREAGAQWLGTPQKALGDRVPLVIARTSKGKQEVLNLLRAIEDGGYL